MRTTKLTTSLGATALALAIAAPGLADNNFKNKYDDASRWYVCYDMSESGTTEYGSLDDAKAGATADSRTPVGYVGYDAPLYMWPPNHKMQTTTFYAVPEDSEDENVTLTTSGTHDEIDQETGEELNGSGNTEGDVTESSTVESSYGQGSTANEHDIRSERSGRGDGRTYDMDVTEVTFDDDMCSWTGEEFNVEVPHDMRGGAGWKHDEDGDGDGDRGNGNNDRDNG